MINSGHRTCHPSTIHFCIITTSLTKAHKERYTTCPYVYWVQVLTSALWGQCCLVLFLENYQPWECPRGLTAARRHHITPIVHSYHLFLWLNLFISWYSLLISFDNIAPTLLDPVFNLPYVPLVSLSFFVAHRTPFFLGDLSQLALWSPSGQGMNSIGQALKPCWFSQEWLIR